MCTCSPMSGALTMFRMQKTNRQRRSGIRSDKGIIAIAETLMTGQTLNFSDKMEQITLWLKCRAGFCFKNDYTSNNTSTLKVMQILIIWYSSCEWKRLVAYNATTELLTVKYAVPDFTTPQTAEVVAAAAAGQSHVTLKREILVGGWLLVKPYIFLRCGYNKEPNAGIIWL